MSVLQQERPRSTPRQTSRPFKKEDVNPSNRGTNNRVSLLLGVFIFGVSLCAGGLLKLKSSMASSWSSMASQYTWLVLVEGTQLQADEVGRFLSQLNGIKDVSFVPSDAIVNQLKQQSLYPSEFDGQDSNLFPPSWRISWEPAQLLKLPVSDLMSEIRQFPGVLDVAFDQRRFNQIKSTYHHWAQVQLFLSILAVVFLSLLLLFVGRAVFFSQWKPFNFKAFSWITAQGVVWWGLGGLVVLKLFGALPVAFYAVGFCVGGLIYMRKASFKK